MAAPHGVHTATDTPHMAPGNSHWVSTITAAGLLHMGWVGGRQRMQSQQQWASRREGGERGRAAATKPASALALAASFCYHTPDVRLEGRRHGGREALLAAQLTSHACVSYAHHNERIVCVQIGRAAATVAPAVSACVCYCTAGLLSHD